MSRLRKTERNTTQSPAILGISWTIVSVGKAFLGCLVCLCCALADDSGLRQLETRIDAAIANNKSAEAIEIVNEGLKQKPDWRGGWWRLGNVLYQADRYAQARPAFERLTSLDPLVIGVVITPSLSLSQAVSQGRTSCAQ